SPTISRRVWVFCPEFRGNTPRSFGSGRGSRKRAAHPNDRELQTRGDDGVSKRPQIGQDAEIHSTLPQFRNQVPERLDARRCHGYPAGEVTRALVNAFEGLRWQVVAVQATSLYTFQPVPFVGDHRDTLAEHRY